VGVPVVSTAKRRGLATGSAITPTSVADPASWSWKLLLIVELCDRKRPNAMRSTLYPAQALHRKTSPTPHPSRHLPPKEGAPKPLRAPESEVKDRHVAGVAQIRGPNKLAEEAGARPHDGAETSPKSSMRVRRRYAMP